MGRFSKLERDLHPTTPPPVPGAPGAATPGAGATPAPGTAALPGGRLGGAAGAPEPSDYPSFVQRADDHFFSGEFEKALRFYSKALQMESTHQYPWLGQISCLIEMNQLNEADLWVQRSLEQFPDDAALLSMRGVVLARRGMTKRALGASDYAMTRGSSVFAWVARGEVLLLAESRNASLCFEKALETAGADDWQTPFRIGRLYFRQGLWASALEFFQKSAARRAANFWLWFQLGNCYMRLSVRREAIDALRQSVALNPSYPPAADALRRAIHQPIWSRLFGLFRRRGAA